MKIKICIDKECTERAVQFSRCSLHLKEWRSGHKGLKKSETGCKSGTCSTSSTPKRKARLKPYTPKRLRDRQKIAEVKAMLRQKWEDEGVECRECREMFENGETPLSSGFLDLNNSYTYAHVLAVGASGDTGAESDPENIIPLCPAHHEQMDAGRGQLTRKDMHIWELIEEITLKMKNKYL